MHTIFFTTNFQVFRYFQTFATNCSKRCSYIQKITLNLIETPRTSIYIAKTTKNTKLHFRSSHFIKNPYLLKTRHSKKSAFYADVYGTINIFHISILAIFFHILRATQPDSCLSFIYQCLFVRGHALGYFHRICKCQAALFRIS